MCVLIPGGFRALLEFVTDYFKTLWNDRPRRDSLLGFAASVALHTVFVTILGMIVIRHARNGFEVITIDTVQEIDDRRPLEGPVEQLSLISGESGGTEEGDNSNVKGLENLRDLAPAEPIVMQERQPAFIPDARFPAPALQFKNDFAGRGTGARGNNLGAQGGNEASERAVKLGLQWLASHQAANGSWSFHHGDDNPGGLAECTSAATGLALLSFLGAGHTQRLGKGQSEYRNTVNRGLNYLVGHVKRGPDGGDLRGKVVSNEGMYAHAIATLALCEALAMTKDGKLRSPAQHAVDFIVNAQDKNGGGWRYKPKEPGDTTVTGWQVMALKSAKAAELKVPDDVVQKAHKFLDSVSTVGGSQYAYTPGGGPGTPGITAIGLLCRMYLGWTPEIPALEKGVEFLSETGPSPNNLYYNYYATQVLHHWGGEPWSKWNDVLREQLVETQIQEGDAAGSWVPTGDHGSGPGGKLYQTTLSIMTLEVYYRYMPMYRHGAAGKPKS
jgi:hypothetical protein